MMNLDSRLLRYFVTVAEERHFGRAADRLHIAQPPLSQQIRKLEATVGVELFDRSRRPIELTDAGTALLAEARLVLVHSERAYAAARRAAAGELGHLRIGAMQAAVDGILPHVMREHRKAFPDVQLELSEEGSTEQVAHLLTHRLDVGFLRGPVDDPTLTIETLLEDPLSAVLPDQHPLAAHARIDPAMLAHEHLILWTRTAAPTTYADVVALLRRYNLQALRMSESARIQTILALVAAGTGIALLPTSFANLGRHGVRFVPLGGSLPHRPLEMTWRADDHSPSAAGFIEIARSSTEDYVHDLVVRHPQLRPYYPRST